MTAATILEASATVQCRLGKHGGRHDRRFQERSDVVAKSTVKSAIQRLSGPVQGLFLPTSVQRSQTALS